MKKSTLCNLMLVLALLAYCSHTALNAQRTEIKRTLNTVDDKGISSYTLDNLLSSSYGIGVALDPKGNFKVNSAFCPLPPTNIVMGGPGTLTTTSALIIWDFIPNQVNPFAIRYRIMGTSSWLMIQVSDHQITITGLTPGTTYEFQVANTTAVCPLDDADWSALQTFTTISLPKPGDSFQNPIQIGNIDATMSFSDTQNNSPANHFGNKYGQPGDDIIYKFSVDLRSNVMIDHCSSGISDSYMYLLDANMNLIAFDDDNGPACPTLFLKASIIKILEPGTYYIVSEGYWLTTGDITTNVRVLYNPGTNSGTANIIDFTQRRCLTYFDTQNNGSRQFMNRFGRPTPEIYYKLLLGDPETIHINTCGSGLFDTYLHVFNVVGQEIFTNDDFGPLCNSWQASLSVNLQAGTYYIVVEGYSSTGPISLGVDNLGGTVFCGTLSLVTPATGSTANAMTEKPEVPTGITLYPDPIIEKTKKKNAPVPEKLDISSDNITLYPNPANESVNLKIPQLQEATTINITDASGRILSKIQTSNIETEINTSNLANGFYFVIFKLGNETVTKKLQVMR